MLVECGKRTGQPLGALNALIIERFKSRINAIEIFANAAEQPRRCFALRRKQRTHRFEFFGHVVDAFCDGLSRIRAGSRQGGLRLIDKRDHRSPLRIHILPCGIARRRRPIECSIDGIGHFRRRFFKPLARICADAFDA